MGQDQDVKHDERSPDDKDGSEEKSETSQAEQAGEQDESAGSSADPAKAVASQEDSGGAEQAGEQDETADSSADPAEAVGSQEDSGGAPQSAGDGGPPAGPAPSPARAAAGAAWAQPFVRLERGLSWIESRLLFLVLLALVLSMCVWVSFTGLSSPLQTGNVAGTVFRMLVGAAVLGGLSRLAMRRVSWSEPVRSGITVAVMLAAILVAPLWRSVGVQYFGGMLNWLQEGSTLTLFGGLRGLATRLTLLAALIGSSLAAASGKHINIDVFMRLMKPAWRLPAHTLGAIATAAVCFTAAWGFFDYTSIEGFGLKRDAPAMEKIAEVRKEVMQHFFIWRKQIGLDVKALPVVLAGDKWDDASRMNGRSYNAWVESAGFRDYFTKEEVDSILSTPEGLEQPRLPMVVVPGGAVRGLFIDDMNLMFPIGLILIGLRVLLRTLLAMSGHIAIDPDAEQPDEDDGGGQPAEPAPAGKGGA